MAKLNHIDFSLFYYNGSSWVDTYNSVTFTNISNNSNYPSFTSQLERRPIVNPSLRKVGGQNLSMDSGGFWYQYTFRFVAKNANGHSVLEGLLDKTQSMNTTNPFFRLYPDVVTDNTDYIEVLFAGFSDEIFVEDTVRGGTFVFESRTKGTTWSTQ